MMTTFWRLGMKNPKPFGERLPLLHAGMTYQRTGDIVERLFGDLTHLSFVVELGARGWRERNRAWGK